MHLGLSDAFVVAIPFGAEPEAIPVAPNPPLSVERDFLLIPIGEELELIEQHEGVNGAIVRRVPFEVRERGCSILVRQPGNEGWELLWSIWYRLRCRLRVPGVRVRRRRRLGRGDCRERQAQRQSTGGRTKEESRVHSSTLTSRNMPLSMWNKR